VCQSAQHLALRLSAITFYARSIPTSTPLFSPSSKWSQSRDQRKLPCRQRAWSECWPEDIAEMTYCTALTTTLTARRQHRLYVIVGSADSNCVSNSLPGSAECPHLAAATAGGDPLTSTVISFRHAYYCQRLPSSYRQVDQLTWLGPQHRVFAAAVMSTEHFAQVASRVCSVQYAWHIFVSIFTARRYAWAVYVVIVYTSVPLSVTNRCPTKTAIPRITQTTPMDLDSSSLKPNI